MKSEDALLGAWNKTLKKGEAPAIFHAHGRDPRSFRAIEEAARAFESRLEGFSASAVLAIQLGNHIDWPSIFLACLRRKLVVLPLETSMSEQEREAALAICHVSGLVAAGPSRTGIVSGGEAPVVLPLETEAARSTKINWHGTPPSLLKLTSGTTAAPRAIRFQTAQLLADCKNICNTMGITADDLNFGVIPISHSYGLSNLLTPLLACGVPVVLSNDRLPRAVLDNLAHTGATIFPGMPVFYQAFCEMEELPRLPNLRLCISAGAPLTATIAKKFRDKFNRSIHSFYGSSECGGICYDRDGKVLEDGFVGTPLEGVDLERVDLSAESSQVRVRSAAVGDGYFPEQDNEKLGNGIFVPDDLLARTADRWRITGRVSDVINVAGKKVNPAEVEAQLMRFAGVRQAIVFGRKSSRRNEEVTACVVADLNVREADLLKFCRAALSGWQVPKRIFLMDEIPVNERGKTSRRELAGRFQGAE